MTTPWSQGLASGESLHEPVSGLSTGVTYHARMQMRLDEASPIVSAGEVVFTPAVIPPNAGVTWVSPLGATAEAGWESTSRAMDDHEGTCARVYHVALDPNLWSSYIHLQANLRADGIRILAKADAFIDAVAIDVLRDGAWVAVHNGTFSNMTYNEFYFDGGLVTEARLKFHLNTANVGQFWELYETDFHREVPALPPPTITPSGGTFDKPLTVTITPTPPSPLPDTPGWRVGVKYLGATLPPGVTVTEQATALSRDGSTVVAMQAFTDANAMNLFPGVSLSPDRGGFPFYLWSLNDPSHRYDPALFVGVTSNLSWDGNNYDFYYAETGDRVFALLHQNWDNSGVYISLWSCRAGERQYDKPGQKLASFPPLPIETFSRQSTELVFENNKVRLLIGGNPLVSEPNTDAFGRAVYTGDAASGRLPGVLGATRFWFTLAGGDVPGRRDLILSGEPQVKARFTYNGAPVTESSTEYTGPLTLTYGGQLRARCFSPAASPSAEAVATFTSSIPQLPSESYVSPAHLSITHATLDGSPAEVSVTGPSGMIDGKEIGDFLHLIDYPLLNTAPTPLVLCRNGVVDPSQDVLWKVIDLANTELEQIQIRRGDSLLLTAGEDQSGALEIEVTNSQSEVFATRTGTAGQVFPILFDQGGTFTAAATVNGGTATSTLTINVVHVDLQAPIACGVGFRREKTVLVYGGTGEEIFFTANDPTVLQVSVKEPANQDGEVRLYLKALKRGTPILQARLGSPTGPILATQEIDEFQVDISVSVHMVVNDDTDTGGGKLTMKPWISGIDLNAHMFASYSTFAGGETSFGVNTSDEDELGEPVFEKVVDSVTGETWGVFHFEIEMPEDEDSYCFDMSFDQHSPYGTVVLDVRCNGTPCRWSLEEAYWCADETGEKSVYATCENQNDRDHTAVSDEDGFDVVGESGKIKCTTAGYIIKVNKTKAKDAGKYNLKIEETPFLVLIVIKFELKSIKFTSDHHLMNDNNADWGDTGTAYSKPEWMQTPARNYPISQTKNTTLSIKAVVKVEPSGLLFDLTGTGGAAYASFTSTGNTSKGTDQEIPLSASKSDNLPDRICTLNTSIVWKITTNGMECTGQTSGPHKIYVTYGVPTGTVVTEKRIAYVCEEADACSTVDTAGKEIFDSLANKFNLKASLWGPNPVWLLHNPTERSQCPGLARYIKAHFDMLGLGAGTYAYCHIKKDGTYGDPATPPTLDTRTLADVPGHDATHFATRSEEIGHIDGDGGINNYEATYLLNSKYYATGVGIFDSPSAVCQGSFNWMGWMYSGVTDWEKCQVIWPAP